MKTLFFALVGVLVIVLCARDLASGLRTGRMRTLATYSPVAVRAEKPKLFWFFAAANLATAAAMAFALVDLFLRGA
jgi:hypothetical protein